VKVAKKTGVKVAKNTERMMFDDPAPLDENDPEVKLEMFETYKHMGSKPEDLGDGKLSRDYAEWLKTNS
jgi:hypothetical protein